MPYGREAKEELTMLVQGKRLKISVYGNDRYSRLAMHIIHCTNFHHMSFDHIEEVQARA